jgi:uncharacterized phiE125 gp8 family phage protein
MYVVYRGWPLLDPVIPWDQGLRWYLEDDETPDWTLDPLTVEFVRDQHLRSPNGAAEDAYITHLIRTSYWNAERRTERTLIPRTRVLVADGFPSTGTFIIPHPPLLSVSGIDWIDENEDTATLAGSPAEFFVETPEGPRARPGRITPLYNASWPTPRSFMGAVRVTFEAGYPVVDGYASIPDEITQARLLMIGEFYKQRSESVHTSQSAAMVRARDLLSGYKVY